MSNRETDGSNQLLGIGLVLASTVAFSLYGVLTKAIESDTWTVACWRGWLFASVGSLASLAFRFSIAQPKLLLGIFIHERL